MLRYVVHKGSITVDGISLTVAAVARRRVRRRGDPAHARGHDARHARDRASASTSKSTWSPSTWSDSSCDETECDHDVRRPSNRAIDAVRRGEFVVVVDDEDRENEGDLIIAAEKMTPDKMAFMIRYTSGVICLPMEGERLDELQLPLMVSGTENTEGQRTAFTVSVDARHGTTTGISAADRCTTVHALIDPATTRRRPRPARATSSRCATARAAC